jgi:hypothetical protein
MRRKEEAVGAGLRPVHLLTARIPMVGARVLDGHPSVHGVRGGCTGSPAVHAGVTAEGYMGDLAGAPEKGRCG